MKPITAAGAAKGPSREMILTRSRGLCSPIERREPRGEPRQEVRRPFHRHRSRQRLRLRHHDPHRAVARSRRPRQPGVQHGPGRGVDRLPASRLESSAPEAGGGRRRPRPLRGDHGRATAPDPGRGPRPRARGGALGIPGDSAGGAPRGRSLCPRRPAPHEPRRDPERGLHGTGVGERARDHGGGRQGAPLCRDDGRAGLGARHPLGGRGPDGRGRRGDSRGRVHPRLPQRHRAPSPRSRDASGLLDLRAPALRHESHRHAPGLSRSCSRGALGGLDRRRILPGRAGTLGSARAAQPVSFPAPPVAALAALRHAGARGRGRAPAGLRRGHGPATLHRGAGRLLPLGAAGAHPHPALRPALPSRGRAPHGPGAGGPGPDSVQSVSVHPLRHGSARTCISSPWWC